MLNKATEVPSFPQGNLQEKQEFTAGHRWASVIDFAAGYYAIPLNDKTVPYVAFFVEGKGYYVMLCKMVAIALEDMIRCKLVNWMDNICLPGDNFDTKMANL